MYIRHTWKTKHISMLYRLLALVGLMASFPLSGQLSTRLLLHDQNYVIDEGEFSAAAAGADAYDAVTDRLYGVLHYAQTPDASDIVWHGDNKETWTALLGVTC